MTVEWLLVGALLLAAMWLLVRSSRSLATWTVVLLLLALTSTGAYGLQKKKNRKSKSRQELTALLPHQSRPEFASSESCRACHPNEYASWHQSYHRTMTQAASPETVRGNFDNVTLEFAGRKYHLERRGDEFWVDMVDPDWARARNVEQELFDRGQRPNPPPPEIDPPRVKRRVTMLTGSHHMQAYWVSSKHANVQLSIPFTYLFEDQRWVPRPDVFLRDPRLSPEPQFQLWNSNCLRCHSTAGQPQEVHGRPGMDTRVAEFGISCEACHGPAEEHVRKNRAPLRRYALHTGSTPDPTIVQPGRLSHVLSSAACGQCHSIMEANSQDEWLKNGFTYKPGDELEKDRWIVRLVTAANEKRLPEGVRKNPAVTLSGFYWPDGVVRVSGREYNGLIESPCYQRGQMSCLSCHSMHKSDPNDQLASRMDGNQACLQCHSQMSSKISEHTFHKAESTGSLCYNCHMPHTTYGLLKGIRSHQVTSPSAQQQLDSGRPNACNLCHLDKTLAWTAGHLDKWYKQSAPALPPEEQKYSSAALMSLRGDAAQRAIIAWHMGWAPAQQASGSDWIAPYLAHLLDDPYSAVRYVALRSLKTLPTHQSFQFDYIDPLPERAKATQKARELWQSPPNLPDTVAIKISDFERDDRPLELLE